MKRLNELGARKFVVSDVGPLGCIPYVRALEFMPAGECSASANRVTQGYNKKLKRMVERMNQETGPESKFVYTNTYDIVMEIIQNYRQYGTLSFLSVLMQNAVLQISELQTAYILLLLDILTYNESLLVNEIFWFFDAARFRQRAGPVLRWQLPSVPLHRHRQLQLVAVQ